MNCPESANDAGKFLRFYQNSRTSKIIRGNLEFSSEKFFIRSDFVGFLRDLSFSFYTFEIH